MPSDKTCLNMTEPCVYMELCIEFYPEPEIAEFRQKCNCENCDQCPRYWIFREGYYEFTDPD